MKPVNVELHIEELVLQGFAPGDHDRIGAAVERELTRLLAGQSVPGWLTRGGEIARLDAGAFEMRSDSSAETIGGQVAQAVYRGIHR